MGVNCPPCMILQVHAWFVISTWCEMDSASLLSTGIFVKEPTVIQVFEKPTDQVCVLMVKLCLYVMYRWKIRKMWYTGPSHHLFYERAKSLEAEIQQTQSTYEAPAWSVSLLAFPLFLSTFFAHACPCRVCDWRTK